MKPPRPARIAFYSHDTMGLGHIRRNMLLANTIIKKHPAVEILLINGVREAGVFYLPKGMDSVTLPTYLKTADGEYQPCSLGDNIRRLVKLRVSIIHAALTAFKPDILVVDNVPRGAMSELDSILPVLVAQNTHIILGLRDIIDEPETVRRQWHKLGNSAAIRDYYSSVWVYGDADFYDLRQAYALDETVQRKVSFMGYLDATGHAQQPVSDDDLLSEIRQPYILCTVGGGQDGYRLASEFARATFPPGVTGILLTGTMMPSGEYDALLQMAKRREDLRVIRFVANPLALLRQAQSVVAMGGYNTTIEILSLRKRALIIPRISPRQEQWIRASRLAQINLVSCIHPDQFTLRALNEWLTTSWQPADPRRHLNLLGLHTFSEKIASLLSKPVNPPPAPQYEI